MANIDYCIQLFVPPDKQDAALEAALTENPNNAAYQPDLLSSFAGSAAPRAPSPPENEDKDSSHPIEPPVMIGLYIRKLWKPGRTIRVKFLDKNDYVESKVKKYALTWEQYANIKFDFVKDGDAEVRITLTPDIGSWSSVGTDSLVNNPEASMNFSKFNNQTLDEEFARTTVHEFGHALGAVHEHQQPKADIQWNKPVVYEAYAKKGWTKADVDDQIFGHYRAEDVSSTELDRFSVMEYPIPPEFTLDGWSAPTNPKLSESDKASIRRMYPFPGDIENVDTGVLNTMSIRSWDKPALDNKLSISFIKPFPQPPKAILGLDWLDFDHSKNLRIRTVVDGVREDGMDINLQSWSDSICYSAGAAYLLIGADNDTFQTGQFNIADVSGYTPIPKSTVRQINFNRSFASPPKVIIFLTSLDVNNNANLRVRAFVSDITATGFTAHVESWADTILWSAGVNWVAYPSEEKKYASGTFNTMDVRPWEQPRLENSSSVAFTNGGFDHPPRIFLALNSLDIDKSRNARIRLSASDITPQSFTWHIDSWSDTVLYSAGVSFLAF